MSDPCSPQSPHPAQIHPSYHPHSYTGGKSAYVTGQQQPHSPHGGQPPPHPHPGLHQQVGAVPLANNNHHLHPPQQPILPCSPGGPGKPHPPPVKYDPYPTVMLTGAPPAGGGQQPQQQPKAPKSAPRQNSAQQVGGYPPNTKSTKSSQQDSGPVQSKRPRKGSGSVGAAAANKNIDNVSAHITTIVLHISSSVHIVYLDLSTPMFHAQRI